MEMSPFLFGLYKLAKHLLYPLTWLTLLLAVLVVLVSGPFSPRRIRWVRMTAGAALLLTLVLSNRTLGHVLVSYVEAASPPFVVTSPQSFDAIVVLGGGVVAQGTLRPSDALSGIGLERTVCGIELFRQGVAPRLLFAGGDSAVFGSLPEESQVMKSLAVRLGVPEDAVLTENHSRNTYENAVGTKQILGDASILLVTSASHIPRAVGIFRNQGMKVTPYPCGYLARNLPGTGVDWVPFDLIPDARALFITTETISEIAGRVFYRVTGKL